MLIRRNEKKSNGKNVAADRRNVFFFFVVSP